MSILANSNIISEELEEKILKEVFVKKIDKNPFIAQKFSFQKKETIIRPFKIDKDKIYLPFRWAIENIPNCSRPNKNQLNTINCNFTTKLRSIQKEIKTQCIDFLNEKGCVLISLFPGAGKTCLSIYLASKISLKTVIICHRIVLIEQWKKAIERFTENSSIEIVKPSKNPKNTKDFLLVNAQNVKKLGADFFKGVGLVIIDEIHAIMAESLSECLYHICPRYMIGLSATPNRPDGLDKLLDFYFGEENKIIRELHHPHDVYKIDTNIEYQEDSKTQWSAMITSQCLNKDRNDLIVDIILHFKDRHFLVLCKRVGQANYIASKLEEEKENVSVMTEDTNDFDEKSRIIVASLQKCGVGFSHDVLDALIIASDMEEYFIQYLARVMRTEDVKPIVFDIVDNHKSLKKHFTERKKVYTKAGGTIKNFYKEFPNFKKI